MTRLHCDWCGVCETDDAKLKSARGFHQVYTSYTMEYPRAYDLCPTCFGALKALIATAKERGIIQGDLKTPPKPTSKLNKQSRSWMRKIWG